MRTRQIVGKSRLNRVHQGNPFCRYFSGNFTVQKDARLKVRHVFISAKSVIVADSCGADHSNRENEGCDEEHLKAHVA